MFQHVKGILRKLPVGSARILTPSVGSKLTLFLPHPDANLSRKTVTREQGLLSKGDRQASRLSPLVTSGNPETLTQLFQGRLRNLPERGAWVGLNQPLSYGRGGQEKQKKPDLQEKEVSLPEDPPLGKGECGCGFKFTQNQVQL